MAEHQAIRERIRHTLQVIRRMGKCYPLALRLVWDASPGYTLLNTALIVANSAMAPAQVWLTKTIIDRIVAAVQVATQEQALDWSAVLLPVVAMLVVRLIEALTQSLSQRTESLLHRKMDAHTQYLILRKASRLDIAFFETPSFYDQMQNSLRESWRARNLTFLALRMIGQLLSMGAVLALLFRLQPTAVLVLLLTTLPHVFLQGYYANKRFDLMVGWTPAHRMVTYLAYYLLGALDAAKEIRLFGLADLFLGER
jgi:ABC-type multidrug transport system fused ATPase/permease subunit